MLEKLLAESGDAWIWTCFDSRTKVLPKFIVGKRTRKYADELLSKFKEITDSNKPFFTSDELSHYPKALLETYGIEKSTKRPSGCRGRPSKAKIIAPKELQYAQVVVRKRQKGRIVEVGTKIVFGSERKVKQRLKQSPVSKNVNIAFVERNNLNKRHQPRTVSSEPVNAYRIIFEASKSEKFLFVEKVDFRGDVYKQV